MRARTRRLYGVGAAALLLIAAVALTVAALRQHADLFYTPRLIAERGLPEDGKRVRVGGWVREGSLAYGDGTQMSFVIEDASGERVNVAYSGIVPDLFREGEGVVATGRFSAAGDFEAESILAKHDENYEPRELKREAAPST